MIKWLTTQAVWTVCCHDNEKQNAARKKPRGRLRQSEVFFPLVIVAHHVVLVLSRIIFDRAIVNSDKVWKTSTLFASPFWFPRNTTASMAINTTTTLDSFGLLDAPGSTNSKYRWQKNIRIREKSVYTARLSGFKSFRIQSSHFRFRIQDFRRHDQTGCFRFGFVLLCVNGKTNPVLKRSGFITSPEKSPLV